MIGAERVLSLPMEGSLPPGLEGTFFRVGPARFATQADRGASAADADGHDHRDGGQRRGALHAVELREGKAVSYLRTESDADAGVFWHAGAVLALPEVGLPSRYSRLLEREAFEGGLTVPIASHVHRVASDGGRVLFAVDDGGDGGPHGEGESESRPEAEAQAEVEVEVEGTFLRIGEWDADGGLRTAQSVQLEHATWQHDVGVTADHVVFIESPTRRLAGGARNIAVPFGWVPGSEGWVGVVRRGADGEDVRWFRLDPCLVTHVLGAYDERPGTDGVVAGVAAGAGADPIVLFSCCYAVPEVGQPVDRAASVVAPAGIGLTTIGGSLGVLERWRIAGEDIERTVVDERYVEYPRLDPACEAAAFRYGYAVEMARGDRSGGGEASPVGLLKFDLDRDSVAAWNPGPGRRPSEPVFVRAADGHGDDEGWLLTVVDDVDRGASDLYVLDASSMGRPRPEAVIHLPERMPLRSHGEWVPADRYR